MNEPLSPETLAAQCLGDVDPASGSLVPPIYPSTTYERHPDVSYVSDRVYSRADNPTYEPAERLLAKLEGGADCSLFASGNAAATAVFQSLVPGDHVLVSRILYWGIRKWLAEFAVSWGLDVEFVDTTELTALAAAIRPGCTRLLWLETPANPMWEITDLAAAAEIAHAADVRVAVDSTVATPVLTRPIEWGADLVVHSATKYLNGHSDVLAGAVVTARMDPFWERLRSWRRNAGAVIGPFEAWLLQRGMRTLYLRVRHASETALGFARHFTAIQSSKLSIRGCRPWARHCRPPDGGGFGSMLSIRVAGDEAHAMAVAGALKVFKRATSLGGVESLVEHRRSTEGPSSPVPGDLLRMSIGLESLTDLVADLESALEVAAPARSAHPVSESVDASAATPPDTMSAIKAEIERNVLPTIIARGGMVRVLSLEQGIVKLEASGSPGAILPAVSQIETFLCATVSDVTEVEVVWPGAHQTDSAPANGALAQRVQTILDKEVNPAVAAHRGHISLVDVTNGRVQLRLEGGCQGCNLAQVTIRQGIEPMLRARLTDVVSVIDVTNHAEGGEPLPPAKR